jgi:hypothetical protein
MPPVLAGGDEMVVALSGELEAAVVLGELLRRVVE